MPCEKHGPRASVTTKTSAFGLGFCLLSPSGHVFHTAWETMIKSYNTASIWPQIWKDRPKFCQKSIFMMMTSSMTSQGGLKVGPLYSFINEITTFFMITKKQAKISSQNCLCIGIVRLWLHLCKYIFVTSLITSPDHKVGQIFKLIYLRQYLS